jgi:hypothetical protein
MRIHVPEPWRSILVAVLTALLTIIGGGTAANLGCIRVVPRPPDEKRNEKDKTPQPEEDKPAANPCDAIAKIIMSGGYCSATIVGPKREDGRWYLVSAAHCHRRVGEEVTVVLRNGISFGARVIAINRKSDCSILLTDQSHDKLPWLRIADTYEIGDKVFHCGYGVHIPGNREDGYIVAKENADLQIRYRLSVSQGDSGGGIVATKTGELLSPVCCTTRLNGVGDVWGASPRVIRSMITHPTNFLDDLKPISMPVRDLPGDKVDGD